jgi:hypothetical protein
MKNKNMKIKKLKIWKGVKNRNKSMKNKNTKIKE